VWFFVLLGFLDLFLRDLGVVCVCVCVYVYVYVCMCVCVCVCVCACAIFLAVMSGLVMMMAFNRVMLGLLCEWLPPSAYDDLSCCFGVFAHFGDRVHSVFWLEKIVFPWSVLSFQGCR